MNQFESEDDVFGEGIGEYTEINLGVKSNTPKKEDVGHSFEMTGDFESSGNELQPDDHRNSTETTTTQNEPHGIEVAPDKKNDLVESFDIDTKYLHIPTGMIDQSKERSDEESQVGGGDEFGTLAEIIMEKTESVVDEVAENEEETVDDPNFGESEGKEGESDKISLDQQEIFTHEELVESENEGIFKNVETPYEIGEPIEEVSEPVEETGHEEEFGGGNDAGEEPIEEISEPVEEIGHEEEFIGGHDVGGEPIEEISESVEEMGHEEEFVDEHDVGEIIDYGGLYATGEMQTLVPEIESVDVEEMASVEGENVFIVEEDMLGSAGEIEEGKGDSAGDISTIEVMGPPDVKIVHDMGDAHQIGESDGENEDNVEFIADIEVKDHLDVKIAGGDDVMGGTDHSGESDGGNNHELITGIEGEGHLIADTDVKIWDVDLSGESSEGDLAEMIENPAYEHIFDRENEITEHPDKMEEIHQSGQTPEEKMIQIDESTTEQQTSPEATGTASVCEEAVQSSAPGETFPLPDPSIYLYKSVELLTPQSSCPLDPDMVHNIDFSLEQHDEAYNSKLVSQVVEDILASTEALNVESSRTFETSDEFDAKNVIQSEKQTGLVEVSDCSKLGGGRFVDVGTVMVEDIAVESPKLGFVPGSSFADPSGVLEIKQIYRFLILGSKSSGKSSLIAHVSKEETPTDSYNFEYILCHIDDPVLGKIEFRAIEVEADLNCFIPNSSLYRNADGFILCTDSITPESLEVVAKWKESADERLFYADSSPKIGLLAVTKCDQMNFQPSDSAELDSFCATESIHCGWIQMSVQNCHNVTNAFYRIISEVANAERPQIEYAESVISESPQLGRKKCC